VKSGNGSQSGPQLLTAQDEKLGFEAAVAALGLSVNSFIVGLNAFLALLEFYDLTWKSYTKPLQTYHTSLCHCVGVDLKKLQLLKRKSEFVLPL